MAISTQQQELVDLLRNELAELIGYEYSLLSNADVSAKINLLEELEIHAENIGNAAALVGLQGLATCCQHSLKNFQALGLNADHLSSQQITLVSTWATLMLGYLQYFGQGDYEKLAATALLDFMRDPNWPEPMSNADQEALDGAFLSSDIVLEEEQISYPDVVTDAMSSLEIAADINPELLRGLLMELPQQVDSFDRAVEQYLITQDAVQLRIAQRVAHTVKGAANVVGIKGVANLMHFVEDILDVSAKAGVTSKLGFVLQDAADCLSSMSEFLAGLAPRPKNVKSVMEDVLAALRELLTPVDDERSDGVMGEVTDSDGYLSTSTDEDLFEIVLADHQQNIPTLITPVVNLAGTVQGDVAETELPLDLGVRKNKTGIPGSDIPLLDDVYHRPPTAKLPTASEIPVLSSMERVDIAKEPVGSIATAPTGIEISAAPQPLGEPLAVASLDSKVDELVAPADDEVLDATLNISETQAQELLRLTGESQIGNTQILSRLDIVASGVKSAEAYQNQLRHLAQDLERLVELQTALASASSPGATMYQDLDPLELERYNELNSFASQLHEVSTDAYEAVAHIQDDLKELKNLVLTQRQLGFESQELLLQVRMLPVNVFTSRFGRCVRQAARLTEKIVKLTISGEEVMADSRVLGSLVDPIMHLLRNAVDHGIETSQTVRTNQNKTSEGNITLSFSRAGDTVVVTCSDDGQGLDYAAIETSAKKKGLVPADAKLTVTDLNSIILSPGFSTRSNVSQTSGRGVGLDIVNEQIRQLKGTLSITSERGRGTTFTLIAPMSILSAHTLVVQAGEYQLSVVSRALEQIVYVEADRLDESNRQWVYQLPNEEELLPVVRLDEIIFLDLHRRPEKYTALVVVRNREGKRCGVLLEAIRASEEQIVKPLSRFTFKVPGVVGATILGDGRVSPVIDLYELPGLSAITSQEGAWRNRFEQRLAHLQKAQPKHRAMALVVDDSLSARRSLAQFVGDMGLEVYTAKDGFEAIQIIQQRIPSVILADLEMPRMNGLELTNHLRANPETKDIPIIMITSRVTEKHRTLAIRAGVNSYLNKPWTDEELLESIQKQIMA